MKFSKFIVLAVVLLNVVFTIAVFYAVLKGANVPDSLIVAWFGFTTCELWALASIRKTKAKGDKDNEI